MRFTADLCFLILSVTILLIVGLPRSVVLAEVPTIAAPDDSPSTNIETTTATDQRIISNTEKSALSFLKDCRIFGFDPMQLACTTCAILPEKHQNKCGECCQPYKTLENRSKRYEMAYLLNTGFPESVQEFVRDDKDGILERKGSSRFHVQDFAVDRSMMGMMGMFQQEPSAIFWFDKLINVASNIDEIKENADEITVLSGRGLGRDDLRDMLLTLLPDKV